MTCLCLGEMGSCLSCSISLGFFPKTAPRCSDPGVDFFFCSVFEVCGLSEVFEFCHFLIFFPDQLVYLHCLHGQLSDSLSGFFPICFALSLKRATSSANLKIGQTYSDHNACCHTKTEETYHSNSALRSIPTLYRPVLALTLSHISVRAASREPVWGRGLGWRWGGGGGGGAHWESEKRPVDLPYLRQTTFPLTTLLLPLPSPLYL